MTDEPSRKPINPQALPLPDAARLLANVGGRPVAEETLRADVAAGAPTNRDGTINLVHYAAWLVKELGRGAGD